MKEGGNGGMNEWITKLVNKRTNTLTTKSDRFFHSFLVSQSFIASAFYLRLILFHYSVHWIVWLIGSSLPSLLSSLIYFIVYLLAFVLFIYSFVCLLIDCVCVCVGVCVCVWGVRFLLFFIIHSSVRLFFIDRLTYSSFLHLFTEW